MYQPREGTSMSVWTTLDRVMALTSAAERRSRSDELVDEIADGLAVAGEYVTRVDVLPTQQVVDFNWAAHQAGRRLGVRIHVEVEHAKASVDGQGQVRVTPLRPPD
jgi:hypothetical protein